MSTLDLSTLAVDNIRAEMARRRMSQRDIAEAVGISQPSLSQKLANKRPIDLGELAAIAQALGVPAVDLLKDAA